MHVSNLTHAVRVGSVHVGTKAKQTDGYILYPTALVMEWDATFPKEMRKKHLGIVYFLAVNGEVVKIGQSSGKSGIAGCMGFYLGAGTDDPSDTRFAINYMMREEIKKGNKVEVYIQYEQPVKMMTRGITSVVELEVPVSPKAMEHLCQQDYKNVHGTLPPWNFQEAGLPIPAHIQEMYAAYRVNRNKHRPQKGAI